MKIIDLDICDGLKNVTIYNSPNKPEIIPGMIVALSYKSTTFNVEVKTRSEDKQSFFAEVIESQPGHLENCGFQLGDKIKFVEPNVCNITQR